MDIITFPHHVAQWSANTRIQGGRVGFVPTMGALHEGHLDLVRRALETCDKVVCSIFVNPLQFSNLEDLEQYPRRMEQDSRMLEQAGCHALFAPVSEELFAGHKPWQHDLGGLDQFWEGPSRPGHFQGVVNVVEQLFFYVRPDRAFFGEKDRQQLAIITHVARQHRWPEIIVACPTVRAANGLALSSRNARLSAEQKERATVLYRALRVAGRVAFRSSVEETLMEAHRVMVSEPTVRLDHFGIAHPDTLQPLAEWGTMESAVALVAAHVGPVRLIDNITLRR